jgi:hypothetical protein
MVYNSQAHQVFHHGWQMVMLVVRLLNISPLLRLYDRMQSWYLPGDTFV